MLTASYSFMSFFWDVLLVFAWVVWFWLLITVFADLFRRQDISGWTKATWIIVVLVLPYIGVFVYLIVEHKGMAERSTQRAEASRRELDQYVRDVASTDPTEQIAKAKRLLEEGAITQAEFDQLKQKALA